MALGLKGELKASDFHLAFHFGSGGRRCGAVHREIPQVLICCTAMLMGHLQ